MMSENILDTLNMAFGHVENFVWEFENNFRTQKQEFVKFEISDKLLLLSAEIVFKFPYEIF